jgi:hypothetical protein
VKKALLAAGVAVAALAGVIVAVVVSSGGGTSESLPSTAMSSQAHTTVVSTSATPTAVTASEPLSTTSAPATTVALPPPSPTSPRRRSFLVGVVDDALAQQNAASAQLQVDISHRAGFDAVVLAAVWERGRTAPRRHNLHAFRNVASATRRNHMKLYFVVAQGPRTTPRDADERDQFASFAAALVREVPGIAGIVVGNEPNLPSFWNPQFDSKGRDVAAVSYEDLLARTYDALKDAAPSVRVIGGALSPRGTDNPHRLRTHSPTAFIRDLGAAYRASGRRRPLMDAFAIHPYPRPGKPPTVAHPKTTQITIADYSKLVTLLDEAFRKTPQRGRTLPILYTEFGVQTVIPRSKRSSYAAGTTPKADLGVSAATQAAYYREALALAYCQPTVKGLFVFHTFDEPAMDGWQSGLYYADRTPKPSLRGFRRAVTALRDGRLTSCGRY